LITLGIAIVSGLIVGRIITLDIFMMKDSECFLDTVHWHKVEFPEYFPHLPLENDSTPAKKVL